MLEIILKGEDLPVVVVTESSTGPKTNRASNFFKIQKIRGKPKPGKPKLVDKESESCFKTSNHMTHISHLHSSHELLK